MNSNINLCGPTTFTNLSLFTTRSDHGYIRAYGNNVTFGAGMKHYKLSGSSTQECYSPVVVMTRNTNGSADYDVTQTQTFTYNSPALAEGMFYIGSENFDNRRHKEDANIILNHADIGSSGTYKLIFAGTNENDSTHIFEKNLNIDVRNATKIGFQGNVKTAALDKSGSNQKIKVLGGLQIITNPTTRFYRMGVSEQLTPYEAITGVDNIVDTAFWVITIPAADRDKIELTATAGTYNVADGYYAHATNNSTSEVIDSINHQLTVPAGDWTVTVDEVAPDYNYYVKNGGTGDGRTPGNPAPSVRYVTNTIYEDGLGANDTANIYVMQRDDVPAANSGTWTSGSAMLTTAWRSDSSMEDAGSKDHACKVIIQSYGEGKNYLSYGYSVGQNRSMLALGPTEFKNIKLIDQRGGYGVIYGQGYSVQFDSDVEFYRTDSNNLALEYAPNFAATAYTNNTNDTTAQQDIIYKAEGRASGDLYVASDNYDNKKHTEDMNIVFDNELIGYVNAFNVWFGGEHSGSSTHTFQKNLNISVDNATKVRFRN
ncbi:MAG: hypothetical protein IK086_06480, partial [Clostridia bacterium]|nr:hypothetical protein [Clostridia bacterium]